MALAATRSTELAEKVTAASGKEMRLAGINWAYSPVADVNSDHRNPVIGEHIFAIQLVPDLNMHQVYDRTEMVSPLP